MRKSMKKVFAMLMTMAVMAGCLTGCQGESGGSKSKGGTKDIEISLLNQGMGNQWLDALIAGFEEKYPEYNVTYSTSASGTTAKATLGLEKEDAYDLYFVGRVYDTSYLEPLTDILDTTIEGENKSIREKYNQAYLDGEEVDGEYYSLVWGGGITGFVYNVEMFEQADITILPRTTDELVLVCDMLNEADIVPLCHFQSDGYYTYLNDLWFAQYDGMDYWEDFYMNPTKEKMTTEDGRYEALKVQEKLNAPENVLAGSNSDTHITMQTKFLEGGCAMMYTGSWLANEMSDLGELDNFMMMKTPVISSITDKLTTVKTEADLRRLISAIDAVTDGTETENTYRDGENYTVEGKSVSAADWTYVRTARNAMSANYLGMSACIPAYSTAKEGAKEFLKYMYSDEGYKAYTDAIHVVLPISLSEGEIDTNGWSAFEKNQAELFGLTETFVSNYRINKHRLFIDGGADAFASYIYVSKLSTQSEKDRWTSEDCWDYLVNTVNDRYEDTWMVNIK